MNFLKQTISVLFALLLLLLPISSCKKDYQINDSLTVYCTGSEYKGRFLMSAVSEYENLYGLKVNVWEQIPLASIHQTTEEEWLEYCLTIKTTIMAGEGPDIFVFNSQEIQKDLYKMMDAEAFLDFDTLIKSDKDFHLDRYEKLIMDIGMYKGNRYILPITYFIPHMVVSEEKLERFGVSISDITCYESLLGTAMKLHSDNKRLCNTLYQGISFTWSVGWAQETINHEAKTLDLNKDTFNMYMQYYKGEVNLDSQCQSLSTIDYAESIGFDDGLLVYDLGLMGLTKILSSGRDYNDILILPIPNSNGSKTASVTHYAMISSSSKNIDNAWKFVKILLGENFQKEIYLSYGENPQGIGVDSSLIDYTIDKFTEVNSTFGQIPNKYIDNIKESYKSYDNVVINGLIADLISVKDLNEYIQSDNLNKLKKSTENYYSIWFTE